MIKKLLALLLLNVLSSCTYHNYSSLTLTEPYAIMSFFVNLTDSSSYFYEKEISKTVAEALVKDGWTKVDNKDKADYLLNLEIIDKISERTATATSSTVFVHYKVIEQNAVFYSIKRNDKQHLPIVRGFVESDKSLWRIDLVDEVAPIIAKEIVTKNAYEESRYVCSPRAFKDREIVCEKRKIQNERGVLSDRVKLKRLKFSDVTIEEEK